MRAPGTIIVKLTARCNLKCDYCYMFEHADRSFMHKPARMEMNLFKKLIDDIKLHAQQHHWKRIKLSLHGGEPLLVGKDYFDEALRYVREQLEPFMMVSVCLQTNGVLIDNDWISLFSKHNVDIGISLDGPAITNDRHRLDHRGRSTYEKTVRGLRLCQKAKGHGHHFLGGILSVIDPYSSGREVFNHLVDDLNIEWMDFLLPDIHHDNLCDYHRVPSLSYAHFLNDVFDAWWERQDPTIHVRVLESILDQLIGGYSNVESVGGNDPYLLVVETDGSLEPLDVLRIVRDGYTRQNMFVGEIPLADFFQSPLLCDIRTQSQDLSLQCQTCKYKNICGGGYLPHRYSHKNGFKNPSAYCADLKAIIAHVWMRVQSALPAQQHTFSEVACA